MVASLIDNLFIIASLFTNSILEIFVLALGALNFASDAAIGTGIAIVALLQNFSLISTPLFTFGF